MTEHPFNCKIGKVNYKNIHVLEDPAEKWSDNAYDEIRGFIDEAQSLGKNILADAFVLYIHHKGGLNSTVVLRSAECSVPDLLFAELAKASANDTLSRQTTFNLINGAPE